MALRRGRLAAHPVCGRHLCHRQEDFPQEGLVLRRGRLPQPRSIDGPCHNTIPPYNHYVVLGPLKPDQVAKDIAARVGYDVAIVDINDLEGQILGASSKAVNKKLFARILKDNPLGQDDQQTPMGIIRRVD